MTREAWLKAMATRLRPAFAKIGAPLPEKLRISCGWPSNKALATASSKNRTIGQCWPPEASADGTTEIFVSPCISNAAEAAAVLVHELVHASGKNGRRAALTIGLTGKMTETTAGPELTERLNAMIAKLGPYPHTTLDLQKSGRKKQGTRLLKIECPNCGYTARTTAKWIEAGLPTCPCGEEMQAETQEEEETE